MNRTERRALSRDIAKQIAAGGVDLAAPPQQVKTLFLGWMYSDNGARPTGAWVSSLLAAAGRSAALGFQIRPRACETGPQLDKARNMLLRSFLETEDDYLLFSDTDIEFDAKSISLLLEADAPIAGALYFTAATGSDPWPVALEWDEGREHLVPISLPEPPDDLDDEELSMWLVNQLRTRKVDALGMGLTLIRRDAAAALADAYERPFEYADGRSEDATFCLRAGELGFESILVPQARVGHLKAVIL